MKFQIFWIFNIVIIYLILLQNVTAKPQHFHQFNAEKCGYESCPITSDDKLNIHLVPHTHDDVGWLKTVDQYYYGSNSMVQKAGVQYILDSVVYELLKDPSRRFIYVESAFFFKWWNEQTDELKEKVKMLVNEGRLEFIGGAWSMNDEATTHYQSIIDQFAWGLKKLNDTFGKCGRPRIGWQIDPFGHSREMGSIFAGMGFDGLFFARLDWQDKKRRFNQQKGEMIWQSSPSLGESADLFTGILSNHYSAPPGFCFDYLCNDEPIIDDDIGFGFENNVQKRLNTFYEYITNMTHLYATNHLMVPMGDDFNYQDANMNFKNMDKIIKYSKNRKVNGKLVNIFYSTPSCYLKALHEQTHIKWPRETSDFFPYSTDPHTYWSGYYTSRPTLKRFERIGNNFLQICKKFVTLNHLLNQNTNKINQKYEENLNELKEAMGIMQHHDAITGTEKSKVAYDYAKILYDAIQLCSYNMKEILNNILNPLKTFNGHQFEFETCFNLNISQCEITENSKQFMITVYNPISQNINEFIHLPIHEGQYLVKDSNGNEIPHQIVPIPESVLKIPNRMSVALYELVFEVNVSTLKSYFIEQISNKEMKPIETHQDKSAKTDENIVIVENSNIRLEFHKNILKSVRSDGVEIELKQEFAYYDAALGNNLVFENRSSGAYIFRPNGSEPHLITIENQIDMKIYKGDLVQEIHQTFLNWNASQIIRLYNNSKHIEFEWLIGSIPIDDHIGKEIITRFTTNIQSNGIFYTDSNGREMLLRRFINDTVEWVPRNYYPITNKIVIEDQDDARLAIINDRAQGGSSLRNGQIEFLIHRRLLNDDAFGVNEALNETAYGLGVYARGKHYLYISNNNQKDPDYVNNDAPERELQLIKQLSPWSFISQIPDYINYENWQLNFQKYSNLSIDINHHTVPKYINLLTFELWNRNQVLIRYENILGVTAYIPKGQNAIISFNIYEFLRDLHATEIRETTLDGNQWLDQTNRMSFKFSNRNHIRNPLKPLHILNIENTINERDFEIKLKPMQIRTFIVTVIDRIHTN